ncbi:unnamed protein product [Aspergillus oryzae RIB40]|uniref:DNA, SC102 n=1 Tax=Aspergillus oryzae (strain ATCC 42149 / RIB 40) TaxID=510516 RepID=Q2UAB5_ASPOR|nr:unnamed protein product [Aspergillus oryzae RIB40]BAE61500.1 unnamed protein product [Aspergillus oryzae RIB40]
MDSQRKRLAHRDYRIGWICALPKELTVAIAMLDEQHERLLPASYRDNNTYVFGKIGNHNVVIACMPMGVTGNAPAALVANDLLHSFPHLQFYLMVGIGGGAPNDQNDIRLGDVVVSAPTGQHGGVVQYDFGKTLADGVFHRTGTLNRPPSVLLSTLSYLRSSYELLGRPDFLRHLSAARSRYPHRAAAFSYPSTLSDTLFKADYDHAKPLQPCEGGCDRRRAVRRPLRRNNNPSVFFGNIASANQVMRHGLTRDRIAREHNVLCFEMEAAGLMDQFACLVIRGISDYSDTHKNDQWQDYASAVAAAFAKDLLLVIPTRALSGGLPRSPDTDSLHSDMPLTDVHDEEDAGRQDDRTESNCATETVASPSTPDTTEATASGPLPSQNSTYPEIIQLRPRVPLNWQQFHSFPHEALQEPLTTAVPLGLDRSLDFELSIIMAQRPDSRIGVVYICDVHLEPRRSSKNRIIRIGSTTDVYRHLKARLNSSTHESDTYRQILNCGQVELLIHTTLQKFKYDKKCQCGNNHTTLFEIGEDELDNILKTVEHWVSWSERKFGHIVVPRGG